MNDPMKEAWDEVADGFSTLGRMMKERYQVTADNGDGAATVGGASDADAAFRQAFERLVAAGRELGARAAGVARDDDIRAQAKKATSSLSDALSATMNFLGEEAGGLLRRAKGDGDPPEVPTSEPPADDVRQ
jgi:hypothetical protein